MIRALYRTPEGTLRTGLKPEELAAPLKGEGGLLWLDLSGESPAVCEPILRGTFGFHPLAVEDALQESHLPKVDDWGDHLYAVFHAVTFDRRCAEGVRPQELDLFLGRTFLVTFHEESLCAIDRVWEQCRQDDRHLKEGADYLMYHLIDQVAEGYYPVMDELAEAIDQVQLQVFDQPTNETLQRIFALKRAVLRLNRITSPQREVLARLARDDYAAIAGRHRVYFRDVYDQFVLLHDINESLRDLIAGSLDTYLSVVNNRLNEVMKTLTIIATLFMPLSFVVGFFGMNFFQPVAVLAAWTGRPALWAALAAMVLTPLVMYLWMRRRGWM